MMEPSCSDCKLELFEKKWTQLLLKWINRCVATSRVGKLNPKSLADVMAKYNKDVCANDIDRAILCTDDVQPFLKYKYPILRLHHISEESDTPKRLYITTTMLLYHCCVSSRTGAVDEDICKKLTKYEQELILKFCENLCDMEATINNVERAIRAAFESVGLVEDTECPSFLLDISVSSDTAAQASTESTAKSSMTTLPSDENMTPEALKLPSLNFKSSITVLPSVMADTSTYSDMISESDEMMEKDVYVDSDEINLYTMETAKDKNKDKPKKVSEVPAPKDVKENGSALKEHAVAKHIIRNKGKEDDEMPNKQDNVQANSILSFAQSNLDAKENENESMEYAVSKHKILNKGKEENKLPRKQDNVQAISNDSKNNRCLTGCACSKCSPASLCCGDQGSKVGVCQPDGGGKKNNLFSFLKKCNPVSNTMKLYCVSVTVLLFVIVALVCVTVPFIGSKKERKWKLNAVKLVGSKRPQGHVWLCQKGLCQKAYQTIDVNKENPISIFTSYSRCSLICMGPQLWPHPIGYTFYSKKIVTLSISKLEYKFQSIPSEMVHQYLAEAFKLFIGQLARLEKSDYKKKNKTTDISIKKISIQIDVESDPEPRLRLNTEEAYNLKIETVDKKVVIKLSSTSFCGVRHGLETLSQMILLDQSTGKLITLSNAVIKDAPTYKYRGLMIDTARNYIPVPDLMRTIDAMASVKLNTFHWRISDVTSFPLLLPTLPQLFEYGAYDRSLVYTKEDVKALVNRAGFRGIRVLIEVAAPGPVGRPWSWSPDVYCPTKNDNFTCDNILCLRLKMKDTIFDVLRTIYTEIIEMTKVDDIIHLSDGVFSLTNCFYLIEDREGYLDKVIAILKQANKGFLPKLPVIWYTPHLMKDYEAKTWERLGVQLSDNIDQDTNENNLSKFTVIHSSKWDLSCEMKKYRCQRYRTWQEMYSWKSWRNIEVFTIEGGEAVLWSDLVSSANLDYHLWPRAVAVAERLWSDTVLNVTATGTVYVRLDSQRWRMLFRGINVQPVWPIWCSFNPGVCLEKLQLHRK